jgi:voltage-gated potassium channel
VYPSYLQTLLLIIIPLFCFSRCNEICFAFIKDAFDKLNPGHRQTHGLHYYQRVQLALRSYTELIINYGILYYLSDTYYTFYHLSTPIFNKAIESFFKSLYFSLITIVAIGYGEYYPVHDLGRFLVMYEVLTGTLLIVVSFTVYVNLNFKDEK